MKLLFIGIRASGKGTQAKRLAEELSIPHISSGDLFREIDTESSLGKEIRSYIDDGNYVPDDLVIKLVSERVNKDDCKDGFILDGFPRTLPQAEKFNKQYKFDKVVLIDITKEEAIYRTSGRRVCTNSNCNISYNIYTAPKPKKMGICDKCGSKLFQRKDETKEASLKRINKDIKEMGPLLDFYNKQKIVLTINGKHPIEDVQKEIQMKLELK